MYRTIARGVGRALRRRAARRRGGGGAAARRLGDGARTPPRMPGTQRPRRRSLLGGSVRGLPDGRDVVRPGAVPLLPRRRQPRERAAHAAPAADATDRDGGGGLRLDGRRRRVRAAAGLALLGAGRPWPPLSRRVSARPSAALPRSLPRQHRRSTGAPQAGSTTEVANDLDATPERGAMMNRRILISVAAACALSAAVAGGAAAIRIHIDGPVSPPMVSAEELGPLPAARATGPRVRLRRPEPGRDGPRPRVPARRIRAGPGRDHRPRLVRRPHGAQRRPQQDLRARRVREPAALNAHRRRARPQGARAAAARASCCDRRASRRSGPSGT